MYEPGRLLVLFANDHLSAYLSLRALEQLEPIETVEAQQELVDLSGGWDSHRAATIAYG